MVGLLVWAMQLVLVLDQKCHYLVDIQSLLEKRGRCVEKLFQKILTFYIKIESIFGVRYVAIYGDFKV